MSMRLLHKTIIEELDKPVKSFFWVGSADKKKVKWIYKPKKKSGLGLKYLIKLNNIFMCKMWWKIDNSDGP
jgi:hypothetical protein